mmetsp:Transcript_13956/g.41552  ORF Transcript_13956/g.41552 Transcript_13956/m.41552 type:complete len:274 (-) Transcript_13956:90-911(-)
MRTPLPLSLPSLAGSYPDRERRMVPSGVLTRPLLTRSLGDESAGHHGPRGEDAAEDVSALRQGERAPSSPAKHRMKARQRPISWLPPPPRAQKRMIVLSTLHLITVTAVVVYTFEDFPYWVHVVTLLPNIAIRASMMLCILIHVHHLSEYVRVKEAGGYRWNTRSHQRRSGQRVSQQPVPTVYEDEDTKHNPEDPEDPKKPHAEDERSLDSDTAPFASSQGTDEATRVDVGTSIGCIGSSSSSSMAERGLGGSSTDPESSGSEPESSRSLSSS